MTCREILRFHYDMYRITQAQYGACLMNLKARGETSTYDVLSAYLRREDKV